MAGFKFACCDYKCYVPDMICHFIFYVSDQARSTSFYQKVLDAKPVLNAPGMTEFKLNDKCVLGLMPSNGIKALLGEAIRDPESAKGIPRSEIYLRVSNPEAALSRAIEAGGKLLSQFKKRDWGDSAGYVADMDGHIIAFSTQNLTSTPS